MVIDKLEVDTAPLAEEAAAAVVPVTVTSSCPWRDGLARDVLARFNAVLWY
jgi:hypothetical protein